MNITRFEPWSLVDLLHRDLDRLSHRRLPTGRNDAAVTNWVPAVDIVEESGQFTLRADVPGVDPADIDVSMDDGVLTIDGIRHADKHDDNEGIKRFERVTGRFSRRFTLPDSADAEGITARSKNGILEVTIPKQPQVEARRITVEAA